MSAFFQLLAERWGEVLRLTVEHLLLTEIGVILALLVGIPLGVWVHRNAKVRGPVLGFVGILQTVPSLALFGFLLPFLGIGEVPAITALALYALLPIVRNTYAGLDGVAPPLIEAAEGLGFSRSQRFWRVELPLAMPVIMAGVRTATVISVGIATLAAFIGAGGLGDLIYRGLQTNNNIIILLGAVPAAVLALLLDFILGRAEAALRRDPTTDRRPSTQMALAWALAPVVVAMLAFVGQTAGDEGADVAIGGKAFGEQRILGEMMALLLEQDAGLTVERVYDLGGTGIVHQALLQGDIDLYPEYTGTALVDILGYELEDLDEDALNPDEVYYTVSDAYSSDFNATWLAPFGFENAYTLTVRAAQAADQGWETVSDLRPAADRLTAGFTPEFQERQDGYAGFPETYGFSFGEVDTLEAGLMYQAAAEGEVDVICAYGTDGRIPEYDLTILDDDRGLFPPYECAPVVRSATLARHPEIREALAPLAGLIDIETMQRLNLEVDLNERPAEDVAREFLLAEGLLRE